jgi:pimeloyl-ACP methyl ester carboxylesterase
LRRAIRSLAVAACAALFCASAIPGAARPAPISRRAHAHAVHPAGYAVAPNLVAALTIALGNPAAPPPGTNIASCKAGPQHPYPVVLVPATFANMEDDYGALAPTLANAGFCVFTLNYGGQPGAFIQSIGPIVPSARQVAAFVDSVRQATGANKVDMLGHSQGGLIAEYYAKILGRAGALHRVVALAPTTHGTSLAGLALLAQLFPGANGFVNGLCPACREQETGSKLVLALDNGPIAQPGVEYTIVETLNELVVTPIGSSFINEAGVRNEWVQGQCPFDPVDHADLPYDNVVLQMVLNALDPSHARSPNCLIEFPFPV